MSRDQWARHCRRRFDRMSQPSSAAGLAALLALLVPPLPDDVIQAAKQAFMSRLEVTR